MKSYPNKMNVRVAAPNRTRINLSGDVYSTTDFGILKPIFCREALPGDNFNIKLSSFTRLAPMPVPPFANINMINRAFYVRMANIWRGWYAFKKGAPDVENGVSGVPSEVPTVTNDAIFNAFLYNADTTHVGKYAEFLDSSETLAPDADFRARLYPGSTQLGNYRFTKLGRKLYDVLLSLGYSVNFTNLDTTKMSLLPLLAYCRVYFDYFIPSQYKEQWSIARYFAIVDWTNELAGQFLRDFEPFFSFLENDYFTSGWLNPLGPNHGNSSLLTPSLQSSQFGFSRSDNPLLVEVDNSSGASISGNNLSDTPSFISAQGINAVQSLQNWLNRKMIAGTQYYEYLRSTFGVHIPDAILNRSDFLGSHQIPIQISDVTSTASTGSGDTYQPLGDYAGKGIAYGNSKSFHVECNDFGYVIVLSSIIPHTGYYQGRNRELQHIGREDFFTPEFENVNTQAIRNDELFTGFTSSNDYTSSLSYGGKPDGIFAYSPRYSEYKKGEDKVLGDFRLHSLSGQDYNAWHLMRRFLEPSSENPLALNSSFMSADPSLNGNNFDRIFNYVEDDSPDHFITVHHIDCIALRKMHSISDSLETDGSQSISVQTNGQRLD